MTNRYAVCLSLLLSLSVSHSQAQNSTKSPYSQFGLGELSDQSVGFNKGMGGVGLAFRRGNEVNPMNPASYSAIDSLTMIFDAGFSGQITNFKEGAVKDHASTGGFDYAIGTLRLVKNLGLSVGVMPFSNIGYSYASSEVLTVSSSTTKANTSYNGEGGLSQLFLGMGWRVAKPLSIGFNASYIWGDYLRTVSSSSSSSMNKLSKQYQGDVSSYKLEFGVQYVQKLSTDDALTLGVTFSPGHNLHTEATQRIINSNSSISKADTTMTSLSNALELPTTWGVGLAYQRGTSLRLGADFVMQKWGSTVFPSYNQSGEYVLRDDVLKDSYRMNVGAEWIPNQQSRKLLNHVRYRIGAGYATPYYNIQGANNQKVDGPKNFHVSLGFGIPIANAYNNRSILNVSGQWQHRSADNLITENAFVLSIGLTFNERWFAKWKVE